MLIDYRSESVVHVSRRYPGGAELLQGRCASSPEAARRRMVGSGGDGEEEQARLGTEQLSATLLNNLGYMGPRYHFMYRKGALCCSREGDGWDQLADLKCGVNPPSFLVIFEAGEGARC